MLSEKPWRFEAVLLLAAGLLFSLFVGLSAVALLQRLLPGLSADDKQFAAFLISSVSFHGATLFLTHQFLKLHWMTWKDFLGLTSPTLRRALLLALAIAIVVVPMALFLNKVSEWIITSFQMEPVQQPPMRILEKSVGLGQRLCFAVVAIGVAPVVEETLFRGILYPVIKQRGYPRVALWSTALLFAAIHSNLMTFVPLTFLAIVLTLLYEKTDTLLAPILAHSFFNAVNFFLFIYQQPLIDWLSDVINGLKHLRPAS